MQKYFKSTTAEKVMAAQSLNIKEDITSLFF
jgi:hypothetical protein